MFEAPDIKHNHAHNIKLLMNNYYLVQYLCIYNNNIKHNLIRMYITCSSYCINTYIIL